MGALHIIRMAAMAELGQVNRPDLGIGRKHHSGLQGKAFRKRKKKRKTTKESRKINRGK